MNSGCRCRFVLGRKRTIEVSVVDNEGGWVYVGATGIWEVSIPSSELCCKLKPALDKNESS